VFTFEAVKWKKQTQERRQKRLDIFQTQMWVYVEETNKSPVTTSLLEGETPTEKAIAAQE
jgi:hypothetical protein